MFNSGITTLNLAISGKPDEFASPGNTVSYIGGSDTGKTVLGITTQAMSYYMYGIKPVFYAFEPNLEIDIERLYGKKFAKALKVECDMSMTLEDWQAEVRNRLKLAKKPISMVLDSTDALKCLADVNALNGVHKKSDGTGATINEAGLKKKGTKAGMGGEAAAAWSRCLGEVCKKVKTNQGLLILLSQIRTNPNVQFGSPFYRSNGAALDFHSELRVWLHGSTAEKIDKIKVGGWTRLEVRRNKVNGEARTVYAPIYPQYGIDDTRSMLHFLTEVNKAEWTSSDMSKIKVGEKTDSLAKMAAFYDTEGNRDVLKRMVVEAWNEREEKLTNAVLVDRPPRFG